jgi:hypothetical protein
MTATTLDLINDLCKQRQTLWRAGWSRRKKLSFKDKVTALNHRIADLWHLHRCETASPNSPANQLAPRRSSTDAQVWLDAGQMQSSTEAAAIDRILEAMGMEDQEQFVIDVLRETVIELKQEDRERKDQMTLPELLDRRGEDLIWIEAGRGRQYAQVVQKPALTAAAS